MRSIAILLILACACVAVAADGQQQAAAAPATPTPTPAATPVAVPAGATQQSVAELDSRVQSVAATLAELKSASAATTTQVQGLVSTVTEGLRKLTAADDAQTQSGSTVTQRLETLEKELSEIKKLIGQIASANAGAKTSDPALAEIKAQNVLILEKLANATAAWSFDHEALLASAKATSYTWSTNLSKFLQRWYTSILTNYPHYLEQLQEFAHAAFDQLQVQAAAATILTNDAHFHLSELLQKNGVPKDYVQYAALSILGVVGLILLLSFWIVLKSVCRCLCCRSRASKKDRRAAKAAAAAQAQ